MNDPVAGRIERRVRRRPKKRSKYLIQKKIKQMKQKIEFTDFQIGKRLILTVSVLIVLFALFLEIIL